MDELETGEFRAFLNELLTEVLQELDDERYAEMLQEDEPLEELK